MGWFLPVEQLECEQKRANYKRSRQGKEVCSSNFQAPSAKHRTHHGNSQFEHTMNAPATRSRLVNMQRRVLCLLAWLSLFPTVVKAQDSPRQLNVAGTPSSARSNSTAESLLQPTRDLTP